MDNIPNEALFYNVISISPFPTRMYNRRDSQDRQVLATHDALGQSEGFAAKTKRRNYVLKMLLHKVKIHARASIAPTSHEQYKTLTWNDDNSYLLS